MWDGKVVHAEAEQVALCLGELVTVGRAPRCVTSVSERYRSAKGCAPVCGDRQV